MEKLMPIYVMKANSDILDKGADLRKEINTWRGLKILWLNEVSTKVKDEDIVKALCDGTGYKYNKLYSTDSIVMPISFKLFAVSNNTLTIKGDNGIQRRFKLQQFNSQFKDEYVDNYEKLEFKKDKNLNELLCGKYKDALLQIIFSYSQKYWEDKKLKPYPVEWNEESKEIMIDNNKFQGWFEDNFIVGQDFKVSRKVFEEMLSYSNCKYIKPKDELKRMKIPFKYDSKECYITKGVYTGFKVIEKVIEDIIEV